jgi:hypothetical protein
VPAQERLRRHQQPLATILRKQPRERCEEGPISGPQPRPGLLAAEYGEFVAQCEQFDFAGERVALDGREQPQQGGEGEIGEGEQHPSDPRRVALDCRQARRGKLSGCN